LDLLEIPHHKNSTKLTAYDPQTVVLMNMIWKRHSLRYVITYCHNATLSVDRMTTQLSGTDGPCKHHTEQMIYKLTHLLIGKFKNAKKSATK